ncbi:polysaccharide deacetylase family protein, partial [Kocuria tytonicola]|uniref:polysaccharide deacetylase family protein n=1 Tax=Kocuria tytonicola TaxID=2055946 RepID=UPI00197CD8AF
PGPVVLTSSRPADVVPAPIHLSPADAHVETSRGAPRYALQWPTLAQAPALTKALASRAGAWRDEFLTGAGGKRPAAPELHVRWEPVVHAGSLHGVRLVSRPSTSGAATRETTVYGDGDASWSSEDLVAEKSRQSLVKAVSQAVAHESHENGAESLTPSRALSDVSFTSTGDMVVNLSHGLTGPAPRSGLSARISDPQRYLSARGRQVRAAMTRPVDAAPTTPVPRPAHTTDCTKAKCIALTFDDGPGPFTSAILDALEKAKARASFFMIGSAITTDPGIVRRMAAAGMGVGNHTWSHPQVTALTPDQVTGEITRQSSAVAAATGHEPFAVRPPYGAFTRSTPHAGLPFVLWDVDTEDWKNLDPTRTTQRALSGAHPGAIVLMHDIHPSTAKALPGIIAALQKQGYTLVTVDELLPGMDPSGSYYSAG